MNEIFKIVLSLSLSGSLLILVLLLCKPLLKSRISKTWQYYVWLVVIARLLLPFTPVVSPVGKLFQIADSAIVQTDTAATSGQNLANGPQPGNIDVIKNDTTPQSNESLTGSVTQKNRIFTGIVQNLWLVWMVVALILLMRKITIYQDFIKYIKAGSAEVYNTALLDRLAIIGEQTGVKKPVELYTNKLISSPLLFGFFQPCIVLPTDDLPDIDFQYTILHELTHYKRRDMFYKWLVQLAICIHWFNPLAYVMCQEVGRICEFACDEAVIKKLDSKGQREYGNTLVNAIGVGGNYKDSLASVTLNESKELLKERLEAIMVYRKKTGLIIAISFILTISLVYGATAIGAYSAPIGTSSDDKIQHQSEASHIDNNSKLSYDDEYLKWEIERKDGAYFYQSQRVRIFIDLRADNSFENFNYDELGTTDLRLIREQDNSIKKVEYLPKTEADEVLNDLDIAGSDIIKEDESVSRLLKEMVSEKVQNVINSCDTGTWYVIVENGYQYIYYKNVPHNYAWQPEISMDIAIIDIFDIGKSTGTYVLLKLTKDLKLTVQYNSEKIEYEKINIQ